MSIQFIPFASLEYVAIGFDCRSRFQWAMSLDFDGPLNFAGFLFPPMNQHPADCLRARGQ